MYQSKAEKGEITCVECRWSGEHLALRSGKHFLHCDLDRHTPGAGERVSRKGTCGHAEVKPRQGDSTDA